MADIIFGIFLLGVGVSMVIWGNKLNNFLPFTMGRDLVGSGSQAYQLLGVVLAILSFFFIFGIISIFAGPGGF